MPFRPRHSLLRVEVPALHTIDTGSVENLFGMWSLFSKTSHAMEDGKRLENLSWRLWNRETFCCAPESQARSRTSPRPTIPAQQPHAATKDIPMPEMSSSLDSASSDDQSDEEEASFTSATSIPRASPQLRRSESNKGRSRGCEKHITPIDLEKIVISIKETKDLEPIELPMPTSLPQPVETPTTVSHDLASLNLDSDQTSTKQASDQSTPHPVNSQSTLLESSQSTVDTNDDQTSQTVGSEGSSNTGMSTHSIVRGFVPGGAPSSYRSQTNLAAQPTPILKNSPQFRQTQSKKKGPMFTIGTSSGEDESSLESHMYQSSLSEGLKRPTSHITGSASNRKLTSFKEEVAVARAAEHSPVFESDDEDEDDDEEVSESAIEEADDSSDWEDSDDQNDHNESTSPTEELFQRVDSRPNLTSRRSLITTLMHEPDRAKALTKEASRSTPHLRRSRATSPNGPSVAGSNESEHLLPIPGHNHAGARPIIMTTSNTHGLAQSPRSTRRNMLSSELTESLRKNLLWERQHRSTGNLAALQRRHTSQDVKNLRQQREPALFLSHQDGPTRHSNEYFHAGLQEYHAKGW